MAEPRGLGRPPGRREAQVLSMLRTRAGVRCIAGGLPRSFPAHNRAERLESPLILSSPKDRLTVSGSPGTLERPGAKRAVIAPLKGHTV